MSDMVASPTLRKAIFISVAMNCVMAVAGAVASFVRPLRWMGWVARAIATPPGLLLRFVIRPQGNSIASYAIAATEGLVGAIVFYIPVAWGVLRLIAKIQNAKAPQPPA